MLGATLYLVGRDMSTGEIMRDANSCTMCKRMIINAGISQVIIRRDNDTYDTIDVADWGRARRCARRPDRLLTVTPVQTEKEAFS